MSRDAPLVSDAGAYGAVPWLDLERRYGAMFIIEGTAEQGVLLRIETQPTLEAILDARGTPKTNAPSGLSSQGGTNHGREGG